MLTLPQDITEHNHHFNLKQVITPVIVTLLWLLASGLSFMCVFALIDLIVWGVAYLFTDPNSSTNFQVAGAINLVQQCSAIILGMIAMVMILVTGEYVFGKFRPNAMRNLVVIIAVECVIILPIGLLFW